MLAFAELEELVATGEIDTVVVAFTDMRGRLLGKQGLEAPPQLEGNAYESDAERFPSTIGEAIAGLEGGSMARAAFGDQVVDHYLNYAHTEQRLFDRFVTDWERKRYFERI